MPCARKTRALWLRPTAKVYPLSNAVSFRWPETGTLVPNNKYKEKCDKQCLGNFWILDQRLSQVAFLPLYLYCAAASLALWKEHDVLLALGKILTILVLLHPLVSWVSLETGFQFWRRPARRQVSISVTAWGSSHGQRLPVLFTLGGSERLAVCAWRHIFGCWWLLANLVLLSCPAIKEAAVRLCVGNTVPCSKEGWAGTASSWGLGFLTFPKQHLAAGGEAT